MTRKYPRGVPCIADYPEWLHEYIDPSYRIHPVIRQAAVTSLHTMEQTARLDSHALLTFLTVVDTIRNYREMVENHIIHEDNILCMQEQIDLLLKRIDSLEKEVGRLKKKDDGVVIGGTPE